MERQARSRGTRPTQRLARDGGLPPAGGRLTTGGGSCARWSATSTGRCWAPFMRAMMPGNRRGQRPPGELRAPGLRAHAWWHAAAMPARSPSGRRPLVPGHPTALGDQVEAVLQAHPRPRTTPRTPLAGVLAVGKLGVTCVARLLKTRFRLIEIVPTRCGTPPAPAGSGLHLEVHAYLPLAGLAPLGRTQGPPCARSVCPAYVGAVDPATLAWLGRPATPGWIRYPADRHRRCLYAPRSGPTQLPARRRA